MIFLVYALMKFFSFYKLNLSLVVLTLLGWLTPQANAAVLVSSFETNSVLRYDENTGGFIDVFVAPGSGGLNGPSGLAIGPDHNLYVTSARNNSILRYNGNTGAFIDSFVAPSINKNVPEDLLFGSDGNLHIASFNVASSGKSSISRYNGNTGAFIDNFVAPGSGGLNGPVGISFGPDDNLYVTSTVNNQILRYNGKTGAFVDTFATGGISRVGFADLTFGPDGNLYVANFRADSISRYDGKTGELIDLFVPTNSAGLDGPVEPIFGSDGNLYVGSSNTDVVKRYDGKTGAFIDNFIPAGSGGLDKPVALVFVQDVPEPEPGLAVLAIGITLALSYHSKHRKMKNPHF